MSHQIIIKNDMESENTRLTMDFIKSLMDVSYLSLIHISEPTRLGMISYAVFCLKKAGDPALSLIHI